MLTNCKIIKRYDDGRFLMGYLLNGRKRYEVVG